MNPWPARTPSRTKDLMVGLRNHPQWLPKMGCMVASLVLHSVANNQI